jgi:tRNA(Ile)-lysidine synthase
MLLRALEKSVVEWGLAGRTLLVAASAGIDSTVLWHGLQCLAAPHALRLCIGHVNHGLRGAESDADEAWLREQAAAQGLAFGARRVDPESLRVDRSHRERPTLQEAARSLRYAALEDLRRELGAEHVATAHHLDDQAETVLLRLLRGAAADALGGIPERSPDGVIVRPLLAVSRAEIEEYAGRQGLRWREDSSNAGDGYARNRLRRHWLPGLASEFNPRLLRALAHLAEAQRRDAEWIGELLDTEAERRLCCKGDRIELGSEDWRDLPEALARRLLRRALRDLGAARDVRGVHLHRMHAFLRKVPPPGRDKVLELPGGLRLSRLAGVYTLWRIRVEEGASC